MTEHEARQLGMRIVNTWRNGPSLDIWCEVLAELSHASAARAVFTKLRMTREHAPSIALFVGEYRALVSPRRRSGLDDWNCSSCLDQGWVECTDERRHSPQCTEPADCCCHAVVPCPNCSTR